MRLSSKEALISTDDAGDAAKDLQKKDQPSSGVWKSRWTCTKSPTVSPYDIDSSDDKTAKAERWALIPASAQVEIDVYTNACGNALGTSEGTLYTREDTTTLPKWIHIRDSIIADADAS